MGCSRSRKPSPIRPYSHQATDESALGDYLEQAREFAAATPATRAPAASYNDDFESLRWFPLPHEVTTSGD